jgi:hypothetical protein
MSITVNINIPEHLLSAESTPRLLPAGLTTPNDPESGLVPLQGPLISMLLFALTRATSDAQNVMTQAQQNNLNLNRSLYGIFIGSGAGAVQTGKNGIDVFAAFMAANPSYLTTLQAAQGMYAAYKQYCINANLWSRTCDLKYSQLANIAQIDWGQLQ